MSLKRATLADRDKFSERRQRGRRPFKAERAVRRRAERDAETTEKIAADLRLMQPARPSR